MVSHKNYLELKLLLLMIAIFLVTLSAYAQDGGTPLGTPIPLGPNKIKEHLDGFLQESILHRQLYTEGRIDAGTQGLLTRSDLESGEVAVIRYGNPKALEGDFPYSSWATREIQRLIRETLEDWDLDHPDDQLTDQEKWEKASHIREVRRLIGYSMGEQKQALLERKTELGRDLTEPEIEEVKRDFPLILDMQTDEVEALVIIHHATISQVHNIFIDQNPYSALFPDYFRHSHLLTTEELSQREITLHPGESVFYAHYLMDDTIIKYTVLNQWTLETSPIQLHTPTGDIETSIPKITTAWEIHEKFFSNHNDTEEFANEGPYVVDGYLILEPYIEVDANGFQSISDSKVLALYHTYTRLDELHKDLTPIPIMFRLSVGRRFVQAIMTKIQTMLDKDDD